MDYSYAAQAASCPSEVQDKQHAAVSVAHLALGTTKHYCYDSNGNMNRRINGANTDLFDYDHENRLIEIERNSSTLATYSYDGDGRRVKTVQGGVNTYYISDLIEYSAGTFTKYYFAGHASRRGWGVVRLLNTLLDCRRSTRYTLNNIQNVLVGLLEPL